MNGIIGLQVKIFNGYGIEDEINEFSLSKKIYAVTQSETNGSLTIAVWYTD